MKRIALIHTVKGVSNTFEEKLRAVLDEDVYIHNCLDDFLADNSNELGEFTVENRNRLFCDFKAAELTNPDLIVTTCSTLTPVVDMIRPFIKVPVVAIDDAMATKGVTFGKRVMVLASAHSTIDPTISKLMFEGQKAGVELEICYKVCPEAYAALKQLEMEKHDQLLLEMGKEMKGFDCVILAQASMGHLETAMEDICGCPVLSSPRLCMEQIKQIIKTI